MVSTFNIDRLCQRAGQDLLTFFKRYPVLTERCGEPAARFQVHPAGTEYRRGRRAVVRNGILKFYLPVPDTAVDDLCSRHDIINGFRDCFDRDTFAVDIRLQDKGDFELDPRGNIRPGSDRLAFLMDHIVKYMPVIGAVRPQHLLHGLTCKPDFLPFTTAPSAIRFCTY